MSLECKSITVSLIIIIYSLFYTTAIPQRNNINTPKQSSSHLSSLSDQDFIDRLFHSESEFPSDKQIAALGNQGGLSQNDFLNILEDQTKASVPSSDSSSRIQADGQNSNLDISKLSDTDFIDLLGLTNPPVVSNELCRCTPLNQCLDRLTPIIPVPEGSEIIEVIDVRSTPCPDPLNVCCDNPGKRPSTHRPVTNPKCGVRNPIGADGITFTGFKDNQAQYAEFPWTTVIMKPELVNGEEYKVYACGGSLIHPRIIVTVAHCVQGKRNNEIISRLGDWNINATSESLPYFERNIVSIIIHPDYSRGTLQNDVALLIIEDVPLQANIGTICLPNSGEQFDGTRCFSSGWGKDVFGKQGRFQQIMKKIDLPVVNHGQCERMLRRTRLKESFNLDNSFMCAGGEGKDTCVGDGGSPLACPSSRNQDRYTLVGAVAWGIGCGEIGIPGVYASIIATSDWIKSEAHKIDSQASIYFN